MSKKQIKKLIKVNLRKNSQSAQLVVEGKICSMFQRYHHIAMIGFLDGMIFTDGKLNGIFTEIFRFLSITGNTLEIFVDQETADEMRKIARQNWFMNRQNVIIHIVGDWNKWSPGESGMKFDAILANPPYCSGLHLKILKDLLELSDNVVCIHPASWLQFPTRQRPAFMNGRIGDFQIIDRKEANEMFDIDINGIVISTFKTGGDSFQGSPTGDSKFPCFMYNPRFVSGIMNYGPIVKGIYDKLVAKCPAGTYGSQLTVKPTTAFPLRQFYGICFTENSHDMNGTQAFNTEPKNYNQAILTKPGTHVRFLNFNTDQERNNAWQSYLTKFARFCICMDESTKLAPYMGNYTQPWDDRRFYTYFGLTQPEIQLIETVIK